MTIVKPHEFLNFLSGKIDLDFIADQPALDRRIADLDGSPDFDGRYRINDFFCYENTWRTVLLRLVEDNNAVFMDVRGFSPNNAGVVFELKELINAVPVRAIVLAVDQSTDHIFLQQTLKDAWNHMDADSPNSSSSTGVLRLYDVGTGASNEIAQIMHCLFGSCGDVSDLTR